MEAKNKKLRDEKHSNLLKAIIKKLDEGEKGYVFSDGGIDKTHKCLDIELPYNYYGQSGFIDIAYLDRHKGICIAEVEATIENLGETIRQVKKAQEYFSKAKPELIKEWKEKARKLECREIKLVYPLIFPFTKEFVDLYRKNEQILRNIYTLFFFKMGDSYGFIPPIIIVGEYALEETEKGFLDGLNHLYEYIDMGNL